MGRGGGGEGGWKEEEEKEEEENKKKEKDKTRKGAYRVKSRVEFMKNFCYEPSTYFLKDLLIPTYRFYACCLHSVTF